jgi:hypothetical protein
MQEENRAAATPASQSREKLERALRQVQGKAKEEKRE